MTITTPPGPWCVPTPPSVPPPGTGQVIPGLISALCSKGWRPILITGLIADLLRRHFADSANIEETDLSRYIWHADERTGILIESIHRWRGELVEKRPACIIKRNDYQNVRWGIGDFVTMLNDGTMEFCTGFVGSHTVFCLHTSGAAAEILGTEVQRELHQFHPVIVQYLGLLRYGVTEVGGVGEIEESKEGFVVPVTVGWAYQENWRLAQEALKLRRAPLTASVLLGSI
jgi:hypothetical protein